MKASYSHFTELRDVQSSKYNSWVLSYSLVGTDDSPGLLRDVLSNKNYNKKITAVLRCASEGKSFILKDQEVLTCPIHQNLNYLMLAARVS